MKMHLARLGIGLLLLVPLVLLWHQPWLMIVAMIAVLLEIKYVTRTVRPDDKVIKHIVMLLLYVFAGMIACMFLLWYDQRYAIIVFATAIAVDSFAYLAGIALGGRFWRSSPFAYSPTKTWEGVVGGVLGGLAIGGVAVVVWTHAPLTTLVFVPIVVGVAIWGDAFESRVKREIGVKDSSRILGPHGGLLDRLDSLAPAFLVGLLMWLAG